jgi:ABC-2 type transport system permease protein
MWMGTTYLVINVVFTQAGTIAGWTRSEVVLLTLIYYVTSTFIRTFIVQNMVILVRSIRKGELDFILTKPLDPQFLISFQKINLIRGVRMLAALFLVMYYIHTHFAFIDAAHILFGTALALLGLIGSYALYFAIALLGFWFENIWNLEEIFFGILETGKQPLDIYRGLLRFITVSVIPVAGISAIPTLALLGKLDQQTLWAFVIAVFFMIILTRKWFFFALRRYSSASS